jgi:repressor LexA
MAQSVTKDVYTFLRHYAEEYGYPPSQREMATACYMSRAGVIRHLDRLEALGCIRRQPALARGITLTDVPFPECESDPKK